MPGPSGVVLNGSADFTVSNGTASGAAAFIFSTEDGTISGWCPGGDRTHAIRMVDNFGGGAGAVYKGLAPGAAAGKRLLYATNFRSGRVAIRGGLNSPWGLTVAPAGFGRFGGDLLVGNFGNGRIHAFDPGPAGEDDLARFAGTFENAQGRALVIDGLWSLDLGNGAAAAPAAQTHGLLGDMVPRTWPGVRVRATPMRGGGGPTGSRFTGRA